VGTTFRFESLFVRARDNSGKSFTNVYCGSFSHILQESKTSRISQLTKQEMNLELGFLGQRTVQRSDLIPSVRNVAALASLHSSVVSLIFFSSFPEPNAIHRLGLPRRYLG